MKVYLVGGAVRDELIGRPVQERDWVVVGSTPEDMQGRGYRQVGREFPVFLHPETGEEYALARTERKSGRGHRAFVVASDPTVSLEEDLRRRDLTINAMARDTDGRLIDPWGGRRDLEDRILRHVSAAFVEDPLRVLRLARFRAELAPWGFRVAPETMELMRRMVASGELSDLTAERVGRETLRALAAPVPSLYFTTLLECQALPVLLPELAALRGVAQDPYLHGGLDAWEHTLRVVDAAASSRLATPLVYALLVHDLGKGIVGSDDADHGRAGLAAVDTLSTRLALSHDHRELGRLASRGHLVVHRLFRLSSRRLLAALEDLGLLRRDAATAALATIAEIDWRSRPGWEDRPYPQGVFLVEVAAALSRLRLPQELHTAEATAIRAWFERERRRTCLLVARRFRRTRRAEIRSVRDLYPPDHEPGLVPHGS